MRVVLRFRLPEQEVSPGGPTMTDAVGEVVSLDSAGIAVMTRRGVVTVDRTAVVAAKQAPPPRPRRGSAHLAIDNTELQRLMVAGMPPLEESRLGGWLLRYADGYTGRANSVLPLGDPSRPLEDALAAVIAWYAERSTPALVVLYGPEGFVPAAQSLGRFLLQRNWRIFQRTLIMTRSTPPPPQPPLPSLPLPSPPPPQSPPPRVRRLPRRLTAESGRQSARAPSLETRSEWNRRPFPLKTGGRPAEHGPSSTV